MRTKIFLGLAIGAILLGQGCTSFKSRPAAPAQPVVEMTPMKITSTAFAEGQPIPVIYSCDGSGFSPPLTFDDVPTAAQSLALIVDDPDTASDFVHWVVFNIDPQVRDIAVSQVPVNATQGSSGNGKSGYVGLCPPSGIHHYQFTIYALDTKLDLTSSATKADVVSAIRGHVLADQVLVGTYTRH